MLYADPHRWGFTFQANAQMSIAKLHAQPSRSLVKVMERSIYSARYCFAENLYRKYNLYFYKISYFTFISFFSKILQNVEYEILNDWFEYLTSNGSCHLDLISRIVSIHYYYLISFFFKFISEQNQKHVSNA
jgi:deoxyadenosine/deoxycytidine kinase